MSAIALSLCITLSMASPVGANSWPPMAVWLLHVPTGATFLSGGIGLVAIVLLESIILIRREKLSLRRGLLYGLLVNLISAILGCLLALGLAALPYGPGLFLWGIVYVFMLVISVTQVPLLQFKGLSRSPRLSRLPYLLRTIIWGISWLVILGASAYLLVSVGFLNPATTLGIPFPAGNVPFYINGLQLLAVVSYMAIGFLVSLFSEGYCLTLLLRDRPVGLWRTALIMNLRSYTYVALPLTLGLLRYWRLKG